MKYNKCEINASFSIYFLLFHFMLDVRTTLVGERRNKVWMAPLAEMVIGVDIKVSSASHELN